MVHAHVDDFLMADDGSAEMEELIEQIRVFLHMTTADRGKFTYRGIHVRVTDTRYEIGQPIAAQAIDQLLAPGDPERQLTSEEQTEYRGLVGRLMWLQTQARPDLAVGTSLAARQGVGALVKHARELNRVARQAVEGSDFSIVLQRDMSVIDKYSIVAYGDAAFANVGGVKSQRGHAGGLALDPDQVEKCDYSRVLPFIVALRDRRADCPQHTGRRRVRRQRGHGARPLRPELAE